ncbi:hypothetical protein XELAEV_18044464mg [Xenopus laevis]|nr:hypothetical protein XELAEV_18044464mg [Xenopus laevis]
MEKWLRLFLVAKHVSPLSEDERKVAEEAKERTLHILHDALKKRDDLLVEKPEEHAKRDTYPLISLELVQDLIRELEKVTFMKDNNPEKEEKTIAYVYSSSSARTIYLCPLFWKEKKYLALDSQLGTLIHEVSHFLGYKDRHTEKTTESQAQLHRALTTYEIALAFERYLNHDEQYENNYYSCCGETSRDSVCKYSLMAFILRYNRWTIIPKHLSSLSENERKVTELTEILLRIKRDVLEIKSIAEMFIH